LEGLAPQMLAPLLRMGRQGYRLGVVLTRAFLDLMFLWMASASFVQPGLAQFAPFVPVLLALTVLSTLALVSFNTNSVIARAPDSLRVLWMRSIGVPATGLSGSVPSLVLLTQPRR
jgi:hypothetical protein